MHSAIAILGFSAAGVFFLYILAFPIHLPYQVWQRARDRTRIPPIFLDGWPWQTEEDRRCYYWEARREAERQAREWARPGLAKPVTTKDVEHALQDRYQRGGRPLSRSGRRRVKGPPRFRPPQRMRHR